MALLVFLHCHHFKPKDCVSVNKNVFEYCGMVKTRTIIVITFLIVLFTFFEVPSVGTMTLSITTCSIMTLSKQ